MAKAKFSPFYRRLCRLLAEARKKAGLQQTEVAKRVAVPRVPVIDLFKFSQILGPHFTSLKTWQNTIGVSSGRVKRRGMAMRLWDQWVRFGNDAALDQLLQYNRLDVVDLPFVADDFARRVLG